MLKSKKLVSMFLSVVIILSVSCIGVIAEGTSSNSESSLGETVSTHAKYFAEVNGDFKEVTKAEYEKLGKKYFAEVNGEFKEVTKAEFDRINRESNQKEEEFLATKKKQSANIESRIGITGQIIPMSLSLIANWGFTSMSYNNYIDTSMFNYSAGNSNKRITLNLKQWRSSGSTNQASAIYSIRGRYSAGNMMFYGTDQWVTGYFPGDSSPAKQVYFTMPYCINWL